MEIRENFKDSLKLLASEQFDASFIQEMVENCCSVLTGGHDSDQDLNSIQAKEVYAALLYIFAEFVRHNKSAEDLSDFLLNTVGINSETAKICVDSYRKHFTQIRIALLNIGTHLPHITDVKWKIEHRVKSNLCGAIEGPLFRISLKTEKYDEAEEQSKIDFVNFTCNSQELQDLVFKLKDAVRHCHRIAAEN